MNTGRTLAPGMRWGLVIGLWVIVLVLLTLAVRTFGWFATWAPGLLYACLSVCGVVVVFSLIAAAITLSVDTIRGRYP